MDPRADIKSRLPIEQLVAEYCQLQKKGRNFVCLCPFHSDSHPSLLVSPDKGIAYCFACQTGGDIFSFYQSIENVDFPTALKDLAEKAGVALPKESFSRGPKKEEKDRLRECLESARSFYRARLAASPHPQNYLRERGMTAEFIDQFDIGFAPDSFTDTYEYLLKGGFTKQDIINCGLGIEKDLQSGRVYDRFRNRIMFPIEDHQGGMVGFGGRTLAEGEAKYVNSPETPLYHKSQILFGLSKARDAIRTSRSVLLVEGYFDVVAAHKAGIANVVAVSGTALTEEHAHLLHRYADRAILCLDQDRAGKDAARRSFGILTKAELSVTAVTIPAKDPDELVLKDAALFKQLAEDGGLPYIDTVLANLSGATDLTSPQGKKMVIEEILPLIEELTSAVEREAYIEKAASLVGSTVTALKVDLARSEKKTGAPHEEKKRNAMESPPFSVSELSVAIALLYPDHRDMLKELLPPEDADLAASITCILEAQDLTSPGFIGNLSLSDELKQRLSLAVLYCEENFAQWSQTVARRELHKLCMTHNRELVRRKQQEIIEQLKSARKAGRRDEEAQLLTQFEQSMKLTKMAH